MYEAAFGLTRRPFPPFPQTALYYPAPGIEYARETLLRCIERGEGIGVVVGPTGCGKTLLSQVLTEQFRDSMHVVQISSGRLATRRALLQAILYGLGRAFRGMEEGELRLALADCLMRDEDRRPMLLLVDEAEALPLRLLDELRITTNHACDDGPCTRLVLIGGPVLEEKLTSPKLESFTQRIVARCYLEALNRTETRDCIQAQLAAAGCPPGTLFSDEACDAVHQATDGVPRLVNQLCDHTLVLTYADGKGEVSRACVEEAWADLQQLPTPWNGDASEDSGEGIIEFGGLDDEDSSVELEDEPVDEAESGAPALRVAPEEDPLISRSTEQLEQIEESLGSLEEEFQPAGTITPEVELVFHDPDDLLNEEFHEEELVVDRYGGESEPSFGELVDDEPDPAPVEETAADETERPILEMTPLETAADRLAHAFESAPVPPVAATPEEAVPLAEEMVLDDEDEVEEIDAVSLVDEGALPEAGLREFSRLFSNLRRTAQ